MGRLLARSDGVRERRVRPGGWPGVMRRVAVAAGCALLAGVLAACAPPTAVMRPGGSASPLPSPASSSPAAASPGASASVDGSGPAACRDGECRLWLTGPAEIPLDEAFGIGRVEITAVAERYVRLKVSHGSGYMAVSVQAGCRAVLRPGGLLSTCRDTHARDGVVLRYIRYRDGAALLELALAG